MIRFGAVDPEADILYTNSNCSLKINTGEATRGTLSMTGSEFCWKRQDSENGFMIPWDKVTVQAITQDPTRCVYFMIDVSWPDDPASNQNNGAANGNHVNDNNEGGQDGSEDEGNDSEGSVQELTEFHIIPDDAYAVDEIYYIMTKFPAAAPMDDESEDDDFFDGENIEAMNIHEDDDDSRFSDAE